MNWEMHRWLHCSLPPPPRCTAFAPDAPFGDKDAPALSLPSPGGPCKRFCFGGCSAPAVPCCEAFVPPPELLAGKLAKQPGADFDSQCGAVRRPCRGPCVALRVGSRKVLGSASATGSWRGP